MTRFFLFYKMQNTLRILRQYVIHVKPSHTHLKYQLPFTKSKGKLQMCTSIALTRHRMHFLPSNYRFKHSSMFNNKKDDRWLCRIVQTPPSLKHRRVAMRFAITSFFVIILNHGRCKIKKKVTGLAKHCNKIEQLLSCMKNRNTKWASN